MWQLSRFTGLFRERGPIERRAHDPSVDVWAGVMANRALGGRTDSSGGAAFTARDAELAGIGEAIERWQTHRLACDRTIRGSFARWADRIAAVDPTSFALFHADQYAQPGFPFLVPARELELEWIEFRRIRDGEPRWVPSELAVMDLRPEAHHRFAPAISTGWSAHRSIQLAVLRGVQELVERDALVRAWWGACAIEEWPLPVPQEIADRLLRPNLTYRWYRVASPLSDHVMMVSISGEDHEGYCFSIGSACRETAAASWQKAALEAVQGRHYVRRLRREYTARSRMPTDFREHAVGYSFEPELLAQTPLAQAVAPSSTGAATESLVTLVDRIGGDVMFRLMTPPAFAHEGWIVVHAIAPALQALHGHHGLPFLGGPAWNRRPVAAYAGVPPHPFA